MVALGGGRRVGRQLQTDRLSAPYKRRLVLAGARLCAGAAGGGINLQAALSRPETANATLVTFVQHVYDSGEAILQVASRCTRSAAYTGMDPNYTTAVLTQVAYLPLMLDGMMFTLSDADSAQI